MGSTTEKIKIIYIASNGRSGSTLLDLLLNTHSNIWTLGEFQALPWELLTPRQTCGCGEMVTDCLFWKNILEQYGDQLIKSQIHRFRRTYGSGRVLRWVEILRMAFLSFDISNSSKSIMQVYGRENYEVMGKALLKARKSRNVDFLVDASKDPYRLYWLANSGYFSIYGIHLTKDPRAFVYSMVKNDLSNTRKILRMSVRYVVENSIIELVRQRMSNSGFVHVRYEDLASRPYETMQTIFQKFGIESSNYDHGAFRQNENHAISGNQMRHRNDEISLDKKWRKHMPGSIQNLVKAITYFPAKRYRYW